MPRYYISTDSHSAGDSAGAEFSSLGDALRDFGCPGDVVDADTFEEWLKRVGGFGFIEVDGERIAWVSA